MSMQSGRRWQFEKDEGEENDQHLTGSILRRTRSGSLIYRDGPLKEESPISVRRKKELRELRERR